MSNKFCRFLSNGYSLQLQQTNLLVKPCCWYNGAVKFGQPTDFNNITDWTSGCKVCHQQDVGELPVGQDIQN